MRPVTFQDAFGLTGVVLEGTYRVDRVVGEGGFGVVYKGHHLALDQPVAIKVLKGLDGGDARINGLVLEKFRAEARLLYTLSQTSLNIVRALHFSATTTPSGAWAPFMVLEWLEGRSLAEDLQDRAERRMGGRSLADALPILAGVAEGLSVAHRQHVVHRDVKPANVFLLSAPAENGGLRVKVLDFGIAKIMKDGEAAGTKGTFASFTWLYAAPEQLDPRLGTTDLTTDVYAFGLMITEVLTGRAPVDDRDTVGIMRTAMDPVRRPSPRARGVNVTDEIEAICNKALAVDPKARYANVAELWTAFAAAARTRSATTMQRVVVPPPSQTSIPNPHAQTGMAPSTTSPPRVSAPPSTATTPPRASMPSAAMYTPPPPTPPGFNTGGPMQVTSYAQPGQAPQPWAPSPPPGTAPPGRRLLPFRAADNWNPLAVVGIILFLFAIMVTGSCIGIAACVKAAGS